MKMMHRLSIALFFILSLGASFPVFGQNNPFGDDSISNPSSVNAGTSGSALEGVFINGTWVNVRSGPGTSHSILKTFPKNTKGKKILEQNGWTMVDFGGGTIGWVRSDLLSSGATGSTSTSSNADKKAIEKSFERWERHLGSSTLDYSNISPFWKLGRAHKALMNGDYKKAYELAQEVDYDPVRSRFLMAKALYGLGQYSEAKAVLTPLEKPLEDAAFLQAIDSIAKPYIDEPIVFKFGGFDDVKTYQKKEAAGARLGLDSTEYYEDFVDINTWKWKSQEKYKEFNTIGGIDCSGFVQRVQQAAFKQAGVTYPISGRTSTSGLWSQQYTKAINPGVKPPPPPDIRPGDMILLDYGHNRYGHSMIYRGKDAAGNIRVLAMGDTAEETILSPEKFEFYKGTYRMNGMDKVRKALTA